MHQSRILKLALLLLLTLTSFHSRLFAQAKPKQIELLNANTLEYDESKGGKMKRLLGDVVFKHEDVMMYCDSAYMYPDNALDAFSNVHIQQGDSLNMYGDFLKYNGNTKKAEMQRNIKLIKGDMTLTTQQLFYDLNTSVANYPVPGKIISKNNTLTSDVGYFYSKSNELFFKKNVVLVNPQYTVKGDTLKYNTRTKITYFFGPTNITSQQNLIYCENGWYDTEKDISRFSRNAYFISKGQKLKGDSLYYDRTSGFGKAVKNVEIIDTSQHLVISGNVATYQEKEDVSLITGKALLKQVYGKDTLFLHADTLKAVGDSSTTVLASDSLNKPFKDVFSTKRDSIRKDTVEQTRTLYAYHKVKFFKADMQGKCDSLVYAEKDSLMRLFTEPVIWAEKNQLTGKQIDIHINDGKISGLNLNENAFIISMEDSIRYNQVKGVNMTGTFTAENKLRKIYVKDQGQTIYYVKDGAKYIGVNRADCTDILILFSEDEADKITFIKKPKATLYPLNELTPAELLLKNFKWRAPERPASGLEVFN